MKTLADRYPSIAAEWDYERNGDLKPENVTPGQHKNVYWKCPVCGQSYQSLICNRTAPSRKRDGNKCPICLGRTIIPGFNSLMALFPDIVKNEWDYISNRIDPDTIAPHTNKKYYWKCLFGHPSYLASVNNKVSNNGGNCPICSHQKFSPEYSLKALKPELACEWDTEANNGLGPDSVFAYSNKSYWWKCIKCGHSWKAKVNNRSNGRGCPNCSKGAHSSFPEQVVYYYFKQIFPEAQNRYQHNGNEIDVWIPSIMLGIEYDGEAYHRTAEKVSSDIAKTQRLVDEGIRIIRIRESGCADYSSENAIVHSFKYTNDYSQLQPLIQRLIDTVCKEYRINCTIKVDIASVRKEIKDSILSLPYEESFACYLDMKHKEGIRVNALWDYEANNPLTPEQFRPFSEEIVSWRCPNNNNHYWKNTIKSVSLGYGCSRCSGHYKPTTKEWIERARAKHNDTFDYSQVNYINSKTPVTIICPKHGPFNQSPAEHLSGKGCPYCAHQLFHHLESLAVIAPEIARQWDYDKNNGSGFTPNTIGINSTIKFWWHCTNGKPHSFRATIASRVNRGTQCAVCHGKQISYDTSIECLFPEITKEWCSQNKKRPSEVSKGSEYKALWKCPNPDHPPYEATVYNRIHLKSGCPLCAKERKR